VAGQRVSATEVAPRVDWLGLSDDAQETLRTIVVAIAAGYEHGEIAEALGLTRAQVGTRLARLRQEIRAMIEAEP
jgi:DNA-directed RNA polymerase specialized sigma24 family protein